MKLLNDVSRCVGLYVGIHGEFGRMLHNECFDCARRSQVNHLAYWQSWTAAPEFANECPSKIKEEG